MRPRRAFRWVALLAGVVAAAPAIAAEPPPLLAIYGDVVHTMAGPPLEKGVVLIEAGKIKLVGSAVDIPVPPTDPFRPPGPVSRPPTDPG